MGQPRKLNPRQKAFLECYKKCLNASEAYRIAYEYKGNNANVLGDKLLAAVGRIVDIPKIKEQKAAQLIASATDVLEELTRLGLSNVSGAVWQRDELDHLGQPTVPGTLKSILDMPLHFQKCISSIERDTDGRIKLKLWDKNKALDTMARYHKLLTDKVEVSGKLSLEELVSGANQKEPGTKIPDPW